MLRNLSLALAFVGGLLVGLVLAALDLKSANLLLDGLIALTAIATVATAYYAAQAAQAAAAGVRAQAAGVVASQNATEATRRGVQAQLLAALLAQYAQPDMSQAMKAIIRWYDT